MTLTTGQPSTTGATIDPVTFEVIRHRLWAINDDQARMAARLSGSPIIFEGYDFNAALTTADGRSLYTGVYILHHGATLDEVVRHVLAMWDTDDIRPGDMFFTNDPWLGALHANDGVLVMPLFAEGDLVGWSGIVTHDSDVGSPVPGSFVVGAQDRFGEAPLIPLIRMVRDFELVGDVERMYLRNTRTPGSNALNMRARVAALRMTHDRIRDLIGRYGKGAFLAAQEGILAYVERVVRSRLEEIPDGTWYAKGYLDHDGNNPAIYPICCRVIKRGDRLVFDMAGTASQAVGPVNCARPAMVGAVLGVVLISLCYDLPWAVGALRNVIEVIAEEGTINNAASPAAVSMASVMATLTTMDVASTAVAKMLMSSDTFRGEAQANWSPGIHAGLFLALNPQGPPAVSSMTDPFGGGGGARSFGDGVDTGGIPHSMASRVANVEVVESRAPQLTVFRRELVDSGGPGRFRGGVALISGAVAHKAPHGAQHQTTASGVAVPAGRGLSGGLPGSGVYTVIVRDSDLRTTFASGRTPVSAEELSGNRVDLQEAKQVTSLGPDDVVIGIQAGGAGFGDPLRRQIGAVERDVRDGLVSEELARSVYGVVVTGGRADEERTAAARQAIRDSRRRTAGPGGPQDPVGGVVIHGVSDSVEAVDVGKGRMVLRCSVCHGRLGDYGDNHKRAACLRELPLESAIPKSAAFDDAYVLREYSCPSCGTAFAVDVTRRDEPTEDESRFGAPAADIADPVRR